MYVFTLWWHVVIQLVFCTLKSHSVTFSHIQSHSVTFNKMGGEKEGDRGRETEGVSQRQRVRQTERVTERDSETEVDKDRGSQRWRKG